MADRRKSRVEMGRPLTPINFGVRSNGEQFREPTAKDRLVERVVLERAEANARRLGMDRRAFLGSAAGMATTLAVIGALNGCGDDDGAAAVQCDQDGARELLGGDQFVMDVQTHQIDQSMQWRDPVYGDWTETNKIYYTFFCFAFDGSSVDGQCAAATDDRFPSWIDPAAGIQAGPLRGLCAGAENHAPCLGLEDYVELMFGRSDTAVSVLSTFPALTCEQAERLGYPIEAGVCGDFLPTAAIANTRDVVNGRAGSQRCLTHAAVFPNPPSWFSAGEAQRWIDEQLRGMEVAVREHGIDAWKCYTPFGPLPRDQVVGRTFEDLAAPIVTNQLVGEGWRLDGEAGQAMIAKAVELGRPIINAHKGVPLPTFNPQYTGAADVGIVARMFRDAQFVVYHSALNHGTAFAGAEVVEGPYDPDAWSEGDDPPGINSLIHSLVINGITAANNTNVYAELGGPGSRSIGDPVQGTHIFGKLLKYVGEDNIVWGTDAIWGGSPQTLIEGFRAFHMVPALAEEHDYPELTDAIKEKILGLNAARLYGVDVAAARCKLADDAFAAARAEWLHARRTRPSPVQPFEVSMGPRTRREFLRLWQGNRGIPG